MKRKKTRSSEPSSKPKKEMPSTEEPLAEKDEVKKAKARTQKAQDAARKKLEKGKKAEESD